MLKHRFLFKGWEISGFMLVNFGFSQIYYSCGRSSRVSGGIYINSARMEEAMCIVESNGFSDGSPSSGRVTEVYSLGDDCGVFYRVGQLKLVARSEANLAKLVDLLGLPSREVLRQLKHKSIFKH